MASIPVQQGVVNEMGGAAPPLDPHGWWPWCLPISEKYRLLSDGIHGIKMEDAAVDQGDFKKRLLFCYAVNGHEMSGQHR